MEMMDKSTEEIFEEFFGGDESETLSKGDSLKTSVTLTPKEAKEGCNKRLVIERPAVCQVCDGDGTDPDSSGTCDGCNGTGLYGPVKRTVGLAVPPEVSDGQIIQVEGEGVPNPDLEGSDGDLHVEVSIDNNNNDSTDKSEDDGHSLSDLKTRLSIDLEDTFRGTEKQFAITRPTVCPACGGKGHFAKTGKPCPECDDGRVQKEITLTVQIPRGVEDGQTLRMAGEGIQNPKGPNSDLLVEIAVSETGPFTRKGADLYREISIPQTRLKSGEVVEVENIDGPTEVEIPPDASDGTMIEVEGQGMPYLRENGRGNLYVRVRSNADSGDARSIGLPDDIPAAPIDSVAYDDLTMDERIGSGGTANVVRATVTKDESEVPLAIKRPQLDGTVHSETVERVLDEAETWDKLDDHDHVVGVVDYGATPVPWIAMEYMDGGHLGDRAGAMPINQAVLTAYAIAEAVHYAHRRGIAHLDLKPENVLFRTVESAWDVPKVADWGLSKRLLDRSGGTGGRSPSYAAPEQFDNTYGPTDDLTDVYQLGAVCFELFTGQAPFERATSLSDRIENSPPDPRSITDVPEEVAEVILTAMAPERGNRYDSVVYVRDSLWEAYKAD